MENPKHYKSIITSTYAAGGMDDALTQELATEFDVQPYDKDARNTIASFDPLGLESASIAVDLIVGVGASFAYDMLKNKILSVIDRLRKRKEVKGILDVHLRAGDMKFDVTIHDNKAVTIKAWSWSPETKGWIKKETAYPFGEPDDTESYQKAEARKIASGNDKVKPEALDIEKRAFIENDPEARQELTTLTMEIIKQYVTQFENRGVPDAELSRLAQQGAQDAFDTYKPYPGLTFKDYADTKIHSAIVKRIAEIMRSEAHEK